MAKGLHVKRLTKKSLNQYAIVTIPLASGSLGRLMSRLTLSRLTKTGYQNSRRVHYLQKLGLRPDQVSVQEYQRVN
jgi:hypothetical protein